MQDDDEIDAIIDKMGLSEAELSQFEEWLEEEDKQRRKVEFIKNFESAQKWSNYFYKLLK